MEKKIFVKSYGGHKIYTKDMEFFVDDSEQGYETCLIAEDAIEKMLEAEV